MKNRRTTLYAKRGSTVLTILRTRSAGSRLLRRTILSLSKGILSLSKDYTLYAMLIALLCLVLPQTAHAATTSQISQFGITWTFDKQYEYGQFANGDYWVVGPVKIIGISPASVVDSNGRIVNGSMINPSPTRGTVQGYDSLLYTEVYTSPAEYDPSLNVARPNGNPVSSGNPLTVQNGSSLISTISTADYHNATTNTRLQSAAVLTVLSSSPASGSFRPPYTNVSKNIKYNKSQISYSLLAQLAPVAATPRLKQQPGDGRSDSAERMFERPWLGHIPGWKARSHHPADNMPDYDPEMAGWIGIGALSVHLNYTNQDKETLVIRLVQIGIDNYGVIQDGGRQTFNSNSGCKWPILFAGLILNNAGMKAIGEKSGDYIYSNGHGPGNAPSDYIWFEEDNQVFYVTQGDVERTHSSSWRPDTRFPTAPYEVQDIGLPDWGINYMEDPYQANKSWEMSYRKCCSAYYWAGYVLSTQIMGAKELWNNDVLFDYQDRYMQVEKDWRSGSAFTEQMWDAYRANYGCVWTRDNPSDIYSNGHRINCNQVLYGDVSGDGEVSAYDAALTARIAVGLDPLGDKLQAADVSGDGEVSAFDAALIAQRAVGLINRFPVES